jgi:putative ABC transport system permease protein
MVIKDLFKETLAAITVNKVRSGLTILGIVIGIASVIGLTAIGQGAQNTIASSINSLGSNLLVISPGAQRGFGVQVSAGRGSAQSLLQSDADAIKSTVQDIAGVAPEVSRRYQVIVSGQNTNTSVIGTTPDYLTVHNVEINEGAFISDSQIQSSSKVAVLGPTTRDDLFGEGAEALGQKVRINKIDFTVIGITLAKGGSGFNNPDDAIYVPVSTAEHYLSGNQSLTSIGVSAATQDVMPTVQENITNLLLNRHNISDPTLADFSILNQNDIVAAASSVTGTFTVLLAAIAGISLLVGGIGIMNMMLTSVTERTREIGLRKAIGAKRQDITYQFLAESVLLTFLGGGLGIAIGWLISLIAGHFLSLNTSVTMSSILLAFGVSAGIGILFGYYPARRAAGLNPIEALRYE